MPRELGGGVFLGRRRISGCRRVVSVPCRAYFSFCQIEFDFKTGLDRTVSILLDFPEGIIVQLLTGYGLHNLSRYSVLVVKGRLEATRACAVLPEMKTDIILKSTAGSKILSMPPADQFKLIIKDLCDLLKQLVTSQTTFEEKLLCQHTDMEAAWHSHLEGRPVFLSQVVP